MDTPAIAAKKKSLFAGAAIAVLRSARNVLKKINGVSVMVPPGSARIANGCI
jgi:hypothetical protein